MKSQPPATRKKTNYRDNELLKRVGQNLRSAREAKGLSIEDLAGNMEVDYSQIARLELGKRNFTISYLSRLAQALDVTMADLLK